MAEPAFRISVRPPRPGDVRALEQAERRCFTDPWPGHFFVSEMFAPGRFHRLLVEPRGGLLAYLFSAWQYLDLHVLKVATLPEYRRSGLARRLMDLAEDHAWELGGDSVTLEVRRSNEGAVALYDALGYRRVGSRKQYYADGEDAVIMTKAVGPAIRPVRPAHPTHP
jgi:ribosomal-protein-alanine N-acetyltransferase